MELLCQVVVGVHSQVGLGVLDLVYVEGALIWPPGLVTNSILLCGLFKIKDQCKKVRFQQTHNQGLRQLLLTVSWELRA